MVDEVAQAPADLAPASDLPVLIAEQPAETIAGSPEEMLAGQLLERLARARNRLGRERSAAPALVTELLDQPASCQEELVRRDARLCTWGVCELLLRRGDELAAADPRESGRLAGLAIATADRLAGCHPEPVLADLRARAWATVGESHRRAGQLCAAEEALRAAAGCLAHGTGDLLVEARLLEFEAAVRLDQDRRGEAAALLLQAASRYRSVNEHELLERALARRNEIRCAAERARFATELVFEPSA